MYLPFEPSAQMPKFREGAKHPAIEDNGFVLYYTDQCPYTYYWVPRVQEVAKELGAFRRKADYKNEDVLLSNIKFFFTQGVNDVATKSFPTTKASIVFG